MLEAGKLSDETSVTGSDDKKYGDKIISASELAANYFKIVIFQMLVTTQPLK